MTTFADEDVIARTHAASGGTASHLCSAAKNNDMLQACIRLFTAVIAERCMLRATA